MSREEADAVSDVVLTRVPQPSQKHASAAIDSEQVKQRF